MKKLKASFYGIVASLKISGCLVFPVLLSLSLFLSSECLSAGQFDLQVKDVSGLDEPWPLIGGLPFAEGELHDSGQIRIVDGEGRGVPAQIDVAATWADGSIRWAQAGFTGSPKGDYTVEYGPHITPAEPDAPLRVQRDPGGSLIINTAVAVYEFAPHRLMPENVSLGEEVILENTGAGAYLVDNRGRTARVSGEGADISTEVLKEGNARIVLRREGWYVTAEGDKVARARVWFYLAAGSPYLRMTHSLVLTEDTGELWVRDYGLEFKTPESPEEVIFALGESDEVFSPRGTDVELVPVAIPFKGEELYMYQDTYPHFMENEYRAVIGRGSSDRPGNFSDRLQNKSHDVFWTDHWIGSNDVAGDWGHARYGRYGLTLVTPYLAQRFPKEIAVGAGSMRLALWSARGGRELDLRTPTLIDEYWQDWSEFYEDGIGALAQISSNAQGMARTHEVWLLPHSGEESAETIAKRAGAVTDPPQLLADPFWLSETDAFDWPLHPGDEENFPEAEAVAESYWEGFTNGYRGRPVGGGFIDWGKTRTMRGGRNSFFRLFSGTMDYYLGLHVWGAYARTGARGYFNYGSWINQFAADIGYAHWTAGSKFKGGRATHGGYARSHTPLYWGIGSRLGANAALTSFVNEYFLNGNERLRDVVGMIGESYIERWDPDDVPSLARRSDGIFNNVAGLSVLYKLTWNEAYAVMAGQLADALIDPDSPNGLSDEIRFGNLYKVDRNLVWLYLYHRATGDERAQKAILQCLDYKYRFSRLGLSSGTQDWAGLLYSIAYRWTGDPNYLRVLNYLFRAGIDRHENISTSYLENHFTTINMPALMSVLSEVEEPIAPFPATQQYRLPEPSKILFRKEDASGAVSFRATVWMEDDEVEPSDVIVTPHDVDEDSAGPVANVSVDFEQSFMTRYSGRQNPHVYYVSMEVPAEAPGGLYFLEIPHSERIRVFESDAPEIGVYGPKGVAIQGDAAPNYFHVGEDIDELVIHLNQPVELRRPDGSVAVEESPGNIGQMEVPVEGQSGVWSLSCKRNAVARLINVEPIIARSPEWLPSGAGLEPAPRFQRPTDEVAFVPGKVGRSLHMPGRTRLEFPRGQETERGYEHFPRDEGTLEFWFRPNWTSAELVFDVGNRYTDRRFLRAGSHALLYRRGRRRGNSPELASVQLWLRNKFEDPGGPGRDPGEFTTGNPTLAGYTARYWFDAGQWYHVAMTWRLANDAQQQEHTTKLFINGEPIGQESRHRLTGAPSELPGDEFPLDKTHEMIEIGPMDGTLSQLRISDTARYRDAFDPPVQFDEADERTLVLFPLDGDYEGVTGKGQPLILQFSDN